MPREEKLAENIGEPSLRQKPCRILQGRRHRHQRIGVAGDDEAEQRVHDGSAGESFLVGKEGRESETERDRGEDESPAGKKHLSGVRLQGNIEGINNAKQSLDKFITDMHNAAAAGEEMKDVSEEQVQAYNKVIQGLEKAADGTKTAKQEQKALSKQLQELKDLWASLSNEARSSDFGKSMAETMSAAKDELAALKTQMASMGEMKMPETGGSLKKELRAASNELIGLTAQYRAMCC